MAVTREDSLRLLGAKTFDLLVIGGGVTGCGIARDAALRGFDVALVEKDDLGSGTSLKSSKLIHGGLRYLEHAQFKLVFEGTNERALLLKRAPHLVKPLPFLVPAYKQSRPGLLKLDVGLWIYDGLSRFSSPKLHKTYRADKLLALEPLLNGDSLKGGIVYYDCMTDDARLTLENAIDARALGAVVVTYARVTGLERDAAQRVVGAVVEDREGGAKIRVRARVTVNASGPWSDKVRALVGETPILRPTKGVHLVVDAKRLDIHHAVVMLGRRDRRVIFAIPWGDRTVIGTTDTDFQGDLDRVYATGDDVDYLFETSNHYFPGARLSRADVLSTWAGLRPLVAPGSVGAVSESDTSREHHVIDRPGFVTIAGGKLTTFRRMAAEVVERAGAQLGRIPIGGTAERQLPGAEGIEGEEGLVKVAEVLESKGVSARVAKHLAHTYGVRAHGVLKRAAGDATAGAPLDPELPYLAAEVDEAVEEEYARTVSDVLSRRVPLLLRGRDQGLGVAAAAAERMGRLLDWSAARRREEVERYEAVVAETRRFRTE
jgi:glycerol-3-phosphate dehydrogenase